MRRWREEDRNPFAAMSADPLVMEYFPRTLSREESDQFVDRIDGEFDERGYGLWALERKETGEFIGYTGLHQISWTAAFTPAVEIGWRLTQSAWGQGLASEAARRALSFGFEEAGLPEVVSFTISANVKSEAVMRRIGMRRDPEGDFDHPNLLTEDERIRRHLLYRITSSRWKSQEE